MLKSLLQAQPIFNGLDDQALDDLARAVFSVRLRRGEILGLEGEPCEAVYWVLSGALVALKTSPEGREQVVNNLAPGSEFYLVPALDGGPLPVTTQAVVSTEVLALRRRDLVGLIEHQPSVALGILASFAGRLRKLTALAGDLALRTVPQRLAALLLSQVTPTEDGEIPRRMTQREMASQLGTVREVVARTLGQLSHDGLLEIERGRITILDVDGLADLAEL